MVSGIDIGVRIVYGNTNDVMFLMHLRDLQTALPSILGISGSASPRPDGSSKVE